MMIDYTYDENRVRYRLYQSKDGAKYNFLFIPGGPGIDSGFYEPLFDLLEFPGNVWFIDLPGNGTNDVGEYDYSQWFSLFVETIKRFDNPILIGHSFGGMFSLYFEELEEIVKGLVVINCPPTLWFDIANAHGKKHGMPDLTQQVADCINEPSQKHFEALLKVSIPYFFPEKTRELGEQLLTHCIWKYKPDLWWIKKAEEIDYKAKWVPKNVPTLITGATYDFVCPFFMWENETRFKRDNIQLYCFKDAGHFPWIDSPEEFRNLVHRFLGQGQG